MIARKPIEECGAGNIAIFVDCVERVVERPVIMSIRAPRGRMLIFGSIRDANDDRRCEAVREFVRQHSVGKGGV